MAYTADDIRNMLADTTQVRTWLPADEPGCWTQVTLTRGDLAAMRAVCRLYACQLSDEKALEETRHSNDIGFNHAHAKIGTYLASWMDCGKQDGVMRRTTHGPVNKFVFNGFKPNGKKDWLRFNSEFVGRDRVEVCKYLAGFYAQQLADFANGDRRNARAKVERAA